MLVFTFWLIVSDILSNIAVHNIIILLAYKSAYMKRPFCWERLKAEGEGDDRG